jgi:hypothetical protein
MAELDLRHLRSFLAVAREHNVTRAAQSLHLARQAVSGHIQQLERASSSVRSASGFLITAPGTCTTMSIRPCRPTTPSNSAATSAGTVASERIASAVPPYSASRAGVFSAAASSPE